MMRNIKLNNIIVNLSKELKKIDVLLQLKNNEKEVKKKKGIKR